jgi:hypothetical protein
MLRMFGQFNNLLLELYTTDDDIATRNKYASLTGEKCEDSNAFIARKNSWKHNCKVYFDAPEWVIDGLRKLGVNVRDNNIPKEVSENKYGMKKSKCPYVFSNIFWFWKLIEYGYKLGENEPIPYKDYEAKKDLKKKRVNNDDS